MSIGRLTKAQNDYAALQIQYLDNQTKLNDLTMNGGNLDAATKNENDRLKAFPQRQPVQEVMTVWKMIYTDGSCLDQANKVKRVAGVGVFVGKDHPKNVSEPLEGAQTNQRAELKAMIRGLQVARELGFKHVRLFTDSTYVILEVERLEIMVTPSVRPYNAKKPNLDLLSDLAVELLHWRTSHYRVEKVLAHSGVYGNEQADRLANSAAVAAQVAKKKREEDAAEGDDPAEDDEPATKRTK
jgi:ribonuclease HI